jgi:hypothetical protein
MLRISPKKKITNFENFTGNTILLKKKYLIFFKKKKEGFWEAYGSFF